MYGVGRDLGHIRSVGCAQADSTHLGERRVLVFKLFPNSPHLLNAGRKPPTVLDLLLDAIEPETVFVEGRVCARCCCGTEMVLVEGNGKRGVGGEDELGVTLAPVPDGGSVACRSV